MKNTVLMYMANQLRFKIDRFGVDVFETLFFHGKSDALNLVCCSRRHVLTVSTRTTVVLVVNLARRDFRRVLPGAHCRKGRILI